MTRILSTKKLSKALKNKLSDAKIELVEKNFIQTKSIDFWQRVKIRIYFAIFGTISQF